MSKRLEAIQKMLAAGNRDPFTLYAHAMELKSLGRLDESLAAFEVLRAEHPAYVPQFLLAGGVCESLSRNADAIAWYDAGLVVAKKAGDEHASSELGAARTALLARME